MSRFGSLVALFLSVSPAAMLSFDEETAKKILTQVEFYFSDSNLPRDQFLYRTVTQSRHGMVSLNLVCSFSRMRNYLGLGKVRREDIPEKVLEGVAHILRKSKIVKVSDDGKRVGRITELSKPEEILEQVDRRTVSASPFEHDVKIEVVESFFSKFGKVNSVRLPHHIGDKRCFCGTALVELSTEEGAAEILKQNLVYAGADLVLTPKKEFDSERERLMKEFKKSRVSVGSNHDDSSNNSYRKGLLVAFTLERISSGGNLVNKENPGKGKRKNKKGGNKGLPEKCKETTLIESEEKKSEDAICRPVDESLADICQDNRENLCGAQKSTSAPQNKDNIVSCEDLKEAFQRFGIVKHVDYTPGSDAGYVCFQEAEAAIKARAAAAFVGGLVVKKNFLAFSEAVRLKGNFGKDFLVIRRGNANNAKAVENEKENTIKMEAAPWHEGNGPGVQPSAKVEAVKEKGPAAPC